MNSSGAVKRYMDLNHSLVSNRKSYLLMSVKLEMCFAVHSDLSVIQDIDFKIFSFHSPARV